MTAPTAGYIYFVESTAGLEDWITDHAGDPDLMDLSLMTEGTHYCKIEIPIRMQCNGYIGAKTEDTGGGKGYALRWNRRGYIFPFMGWVTSRANAFLIDKFIMSDRHTVGDTATYKDYYLVGYWGVNDHWLFINASNSQVSYCKGLVLQHYLVWDESNNQIMKFNGTFKSVW